MSQLLRDNRNLEVLLASAEKNFIDLAKTQNIDWIESLLVGFVGMIFMLCSLRSVMGTSLITLTLSVQAIKNKKDMIKVKKTCFILL